MDFLVKNWGELMGGGTGQKVASLGDGAHWATDRWHGVNWKIVMAECSGVMDE